MIQFLSGRSFSTFFSRWRLFLLVWGEGGFDTSQSAQTVQPNCKGKVNGTHGSRGQKHRCFDDSVALSAKLVCYQACFFFLVEPPQALKQHNFGHEKRSKKLFGWPLKWFNVWRILGRSSQDGRKWLGSSPVHKPFIWAIWKFPFALLRGLTNHGY